MIDQPLALLFLHAFMHAYIMHTCIPFFMKARLKFFKQYNLCEFISKELVIFIQAYLGYYVASKLRFFTPGPIHRISSRDGCYLAMGCLPLNITHRYFILREWVHQYNGHGRALIGLVYHGSPLLGHRQACMDQKHSRRGLFRIDELGASDRCRTGLFESYWRLRARSCDLIGHLASVWSPTRNHAYRASNSRVRGALWKALYIGWVILRWQRVIENLICIFSSWLVFWYTDSNDAANDFWPIKMNAHLSHKAYQKDIIKCTQFTPLIKGAYFNSKKEILYSNFACIYSRLKGQAARESICK
jgi:hypothetical protein